MARQGITGILQPRVPLHHGFGQVADDGDQGHDPSQQQSGESAEGQPITHPQRSPTSMELITPPTAPSTVLPGEIADSGCRPRR